MTEAEGTTPVTRASRWLDEIRLAEKSMERWLNRCGKIRKRYMEERPDEQSNDRRFAVLWSNTQTVVPAIYAKTPTVVAERRFKDSDPIGRMAAELLERATQTQCDQYDFDAIMRQCVFDFALYGRGVAWVRYEPEIEAAEYEDGPSENLVYERMVTDFVNHADFGHQPARTWEEVEWVYRRVYLTREQLVELAGEDGKKVPLDHLPKVGIGDEKTKPDAEGKKATVYEVWDRKSGTVIFVAKKWPHDLLAEKEPPIKLKGFFPCPKPCYGTLCTDSLEPVPDFMFYQDQAEELDELTGRIGRLTDALRLNGIYAGEDTSTIQQLFAPGMENKLIGVPDIAAMNEKGGLAAAVQWMPITDVANALVACFETRERILNDVYQITGISDILRGSTDAEETATAQSIKAQWGSIRVRDRQAEVQRFARDLIRIKAEIIAEQFQPQTLAMMTGASMAPEFISAIELLRNDRLRTYRIDIETDSTVHADEQAEKEARIEFLTAMGSFVQQWGPVIQSVPQVAPMVGEMMMFGVRAFRAGRSLESIIEQTMDGLVQQAMQPQEPPPDPQMVKVQADIEADKQRLQIEQFKAASQLELEKAKLGAEIQLKAADLQANREMKAADLQANQAMKAQDMEANRQMKAESQPQIVLGADGQAAKINDATGQLMSSLAQYMERQAQRDEQQAAQNAEMAAQITAVLQAMAQPRKKTVSLVRGPDGRAAGAEVMES